MRTRSHSPGWATSEQGMHNPEVSVLIIVHNRERYVGDAVRSVLGQSFSDFECVVVDDGSTDGTARVVESFGDSRLRLVRQTINRGIPHSRNVALDLASGRYVAWLDSDDICHPDRLRVQHAYLEEHAEVGLVGSAARKINTDGVQSRGGRVPVLDHEGIRSLLMFRSAFQQSSVFGRTALLQAFRYDQTFPVCEDVDMFVRFTAKHIAANLPLFLIKRRIHAGQTIRSNVENIIAMQSRISARYLDLLGVSYDADDLRRHVLLGGSFGNLVEDRILAWAEGWFQSLKHANERSRLFAPEALEQCLDLVLLKAALRIATNSPAGLARLAKSAWQHRSAMGCLFSNFKLAMARS